MSDSASSSAFARLPRGLYPKEFALQGVIALIRGETWERINHALVKDALSRRIKTLKQARIESPAGRSLPNTMRDFPLASLTRHTVA